MHPAPSLIVFTTLSGAGFGLLVWLGLWGGPLGLFVLAYALCGLGLASSALHLGHPERAWRAFAQWRSSWLSREAWAALLTLGVMAPVALGLAPGLGWLGAALGLGTILATAMIYASLRSVPRWHSRLVPVLFAALGLAGGALAAAPPALAAVLVSLAAGVQIAYWRQGDAALVASGTTLATATGLAGDLRAFAPPHTGSNYLLREMVCVIGRKHARKLRRIALALLIAPLVPLALGWGLAGLVLHLAGVAVGRWLFFAEAEHVVGLYYGAGQRVPG